ncbi:hypothetical protein [Acidisoma sp. 7E03]
MRRLGLALLLAAFAAGTVSLPADAGTYGCKKEDKLAKNHNGEDPTRAGTIGGCGTGQYKLDTYQQDQNTLKNQQIMTGPKRLNGSDGF